MKFAINPATTMPYRFEQDVAAYDTAGIRHMELWLEKVDVYLREHSVAEARDLLAAHEITPVSACAMLGIMLQDVTADKDTRAEACRKLALCRDLGCDLIVAVPDFPERAEPEMYAQSVKNLPRAAALAADYGVRIAVEFLQGNAMVATLATAKQLVRGAAHPALGIVLDLSHFWMDRSHVEDIADLTPEELFLVHVDDMTAIEPELMTDYDRIFPGEGRGIERELIPRIQATGYDGFWSVEVFNRAVWELPVDAIASRAAQSMVWLAQSCGRP